MLNLWPAVNFRRFYDDKFKGGYIGDTILFDYYVNWFVENFHPKSILDVGCGPGFFSKHIHDCYQDIYVVSLDISYIALSEKNTDNLIVAVMQNLPFRDKSFDYINAGGVLEHIPFNDIDKVLDEFERVADRKICFLSLRDVDNPISDNDEHILIANRNWWINKVGERKNWLVGANECITLKNSYKNHKIWTKVNWID